MIAANSAWSTRRRRSSSEGKKDPERSFGIRNSRSPAGVVNVRGREPLRWVTRPAARSHGPAPITAMPSASIKAWYIVSAALRTRSETSADFIKSSSSNRAD